MVKIEIYPSGENYRWRCRAHNGQIVATGHQGFANKANAKRGAHAAVTTMRRISRSMVTDMEKEEK